MNTRRSFFRRFAGVIAAVAMAPEIAFAAKLDLPWKPKLDPNTFNCWIETSRYVYIQSETYRQWQSMVLSEQMQCRSESKAKAMVDSMFFGTTIS